MSILCSAHNGLPLVRSPVSQRRVQRPTQAGRKVNRAWSPFAPPTPQPAPLTTCFILSVPSERGGRERSLFFPYESEVPIQFICLAKYLIYNKPDLRHRSIFLFCIIVSENKAQKGVGVGEGGKRVQLKYDSFLLPVNKSVGDKYILFLKLRKRILYIVFFLLEHRILLGSDLNSISLLFSAVSIRKLLKRESP